MTNPIAEPSKRPPAVTRPQPLSPAFAQLLIARKQDFIKPTGDTPTSAVSLAQHGAATIDNADFPGWPDLHHDPDADAVIETFVSDNSVLTPMSDNQPFVSAWYPLATWIDATVRAALIDHGIELAGPAYITASLVGSHQLEGMPHADDHLFVPDDNVGVVAIIGELEGPRVATEPIGHGPLRPMTQVTFEPDQLQSFASGTTAHCACAADQLVVFPQFAQLHAGPAAHHLDGMRPQRQLLVYRAAAAT